MKSSSRAKGFILCHWYNVASVFVKDEQHIENGDEEVFFEGKVFQFIPTTADEDFLDCTRPYCKNN